MAVYPNQIQLKTSSDAPEDILAAVSRDGPQPLALGELLVGINSQFPGLYATNPGSAEALNFTSRTGIVRGDVYYNQVSLLLHADEADGSTSFTDASLLSRTPGSNSGVSVSHTYSQFGPGSLRFSGSGLLIYSGVTGDDFSANATVETWLRLDTLGANYGVLYIDFGSGRSLDLFVDVSNGSYLTARLVTTSGTAVSVSADPVSAGQFLHVAVCFTSSHFAVFVNGVPGTVVPRGPLPATFSALRLGYSFYTDTSLIGNLDDFRVTCGVTRYFKQFTPPIRAAGDYLEPLESFELGRLLDVDVSSAVAGDTLVWDGAQWVPGTPAQPALVDLSDVTITSPATYDILRYTSSGQWVNAAPIQPGWAPGDGGDFTTGTVASVGNFFLDGGQF